MTFISETADTLKSEEIVAEKLAARWKTRPAKMANQYRFDFVLCGESGRVKAFVETKRRYHTFGNFSQVYLSLRKVLAAFELNQVTGLPCFFVVQFNDALAYVNILEKKWPVAWRGRSDTGNPDDWEPVMLVPVDDFTIIERIVAQAAE